MPNPTVRPTSTRVAATTTNTSPTSSRRVRHSTSSAPSATNGASASVAAVCHSALMDDSRPTAHCASTTSSAPAAAGLSTCRPRHASTYFDALASTAAAASQARLAAPKPGPSPRPASGSGTKRKNRMSAVMTADSSCGLTRQASPSSRLDPTAATSSTTRATALPSVESPSMTPVAVNTR